MGFYSSVEETEHRRREIAEKEESALTDFSPRERGDALYSMHIYSIQDFVFVLETPAWATQ